MIIIQNSDIILTISHNNRIGKHNVTIISIIGTLCNDQLAFAITNMLNIKQTYNNIGNAKIALIKTLLFL